MNLVTPNPKPVPPIEAFALNETKAVPVAQDAAVYLGITPIPHFGNISKNIGYTGGVIVQETDGIYCTTKFPCLGIYNKNPCLQSKR